MIDNNPSPPPSPPRSSSLGHSKLLIYFVVTFRVSITRIKAPNLSLGDIIQERAALEATKQGKVPHFAAGPKGRRNIDSDSDDSDESSEESESDEEPPKASTPSPVTSPRRKVACVMTRPELPSLSEI